MEAVHALALDQRAEMADAIADMLIQHADAKQNAQDDLANSRTALAASNSAILGEEWLALAADIAIANADFDQVRQQLQASFSNIGEAAAADSATLQRQIDQIAGQRAAAFAAAQQTRTSSVQELIVADAATTAALAAARAASQEEIASRDEIRETAKRMPPPPPPPPRIFANPPASIGRVLGDVGRDSAAERANLQHHDNTEQRIAIGQDALEMFLDFTLFGTVKNLYGAITGHDFIRDREMTSGERTQCGFFAGLAVASTLFYFLDDIAETVGHYAKRLKGASEPLDDAAAPSVQLARGATKRIGVEFAEGAATRIRIEGDRVYALLPTNGGRGPNRWMRMNGGSAGNTTRLGVPRTNAADWRSLRDIWDRTGVGDILSPANRQRIADGITPRVDDAWIRHFPGDADLIDELIPMHHIQGSPLTVPLPAPRHLDAHMPGGFRFNPGDPGRSG